MLELIVLIGLYSYIAYLYKKHNIKNYFMIDDLEQLEDN